MTRSSVWHADVAGPQPGLKRATDNHTIYSVFAAPFYFPRPQHICRKPSSPRSPSGPWTQTLRRSSSPRPGRTQSRRWVFKQLLMNRSWVIGSLVAPAARGHEDPPAEQQPVARQDPDTTVSVQAAARDPILGYFTKGECCPCPCDFSGHFLEKVHIQEWKGQQTTKSFRLCRPFFISPRPITTARNHSHSHCPAARTLPCLPAEARVKVSVQAAAHAPLWGAHILHWRGVLTLSFLWCSPFVPLTRVLSQAAAVAGVLPRHPEGWLAGGQPFPDDWAQPNQRPSPKIY